MSRRLLDDRVVERLDALARDVLVGMLAKARQLGEIGDVGGDDDAVSALAQALEHVLERSPEVVDVLSADHVVRPGPDRDEIRLDLALEQSVQPRIELLGIRPGYRQQCREHLVDALFQLIGNDIHVAVRDRLSADPCGIACANRQIDKLLRRLGLAGTRHQARSAKGQSKERHPPSMSNA